MTPLRPLANVECYSDFRCWSYRIIVYRNGSWSYPDGLPFASASSATSPKTVRAYFRMYGYTRYYGLAINSYVLPPCA